jgi:serine/threonine protein kinase
MMPRPVSFTGTTIAQYELVSLLGSGGMGDVYLARDTRLHRHAAVKLLRTPLTADAAAAARFLREARTAASLDHPNICTLYEVGVDQGREFLAMQYIEGETLATRLKQGPLPFDEALRIGIELTAALVYAHGKQILHRDLKPQNVMLQRDGSVKLLDFGLAKMSPVAGELSRADTEAPLTQDGVVVGTLEYMSPEQMSAHALDARSDIFSLGLILYELVGGRHPYRGVTAALTMSAILTKPYPPLTGTHMPQAPAINPVLRKALALDPAQRYATAADLLVDLKRLQHGVDGVGSAASIHGRGRAWRFAAIAAGIITAIGIGWPLLSRNRVPPAPAAAPVAAFDRTMTYWFDVRPADGDASVVPSRSDGEGAIADGSKLRVHVTSPTPGFLYIVDQEGDGPQASLSLVYPVATDSVTASNERTTGWYAVSTATAREHLWLVWSAGVVPELETLRPLVNARDLGRVGDVEQARRLGAWLERESARAARATRGSDPVEMRIAYTAPMAIRHILLHHTGRS